MKQRLVHIVAAIAVLLSIAGAGYETGVHLAGTVDLVSPPSASAVCTVGVVRPLWQSSLGGYYGKQVANGCGQISMQVCLQNTAGTTYACRTWNGSGAAITLWTSKASTWYGCTQRTWAWDNLTGTQASSYSVIC